MIVSLLYKVTRRLLFIPSVLLRGEAAKDAELLVLRHENAVLRRQLVGPVRYEPADRFWFAALSGLVNRRLWREVFPVTPGLFLVAAPDEDTASIPIHLRETAAWLLAYAPTQHRWLARADPQGLMAYSAVITDHDTRAMMTDELLRRASEVELSQDERATLHPLAIDDDPGPRPRRRAAHVGREPQRHHHGGSPGPLGADRYRLA